MGSEVSCSNKSLNMEKSEEIPQAPAEVKYRKPTRSELCVESFYCPFIYSNEEKCFDHNSDHEVSTLLTLSATSAEESLEKETVNDKKELDERIPTQTSNGDSHSIISQPGHDGIDEKVDEAIAAASMDIILNPHLNVFHLEPVDIQSEMQDRSTSTSQPSFMEAAAGNSQPEMMDCATGMSQPDIITVDCGIQTSQELMFVSTLKDNERQTLNEGNQFHKPYPAAYSKVPIVFPRVSGQTVPPEVPAKIPRLSELDQNSTMKPIYSSDVTFDFDEADKENDRSVLRQRGNVGRMMNLSNPISNLEYEFTSTKSVSIKKPTPLSNTFAPSRGQFLRVGLSKKSRPRNPLHPRVLDEGQDEDD